jgi:hypothetical protein
VSADFDGDFISDKVVFRNVGGGSPYTQWLMAYSGGGTNIVNWGVLKDIPVRGDFDGDCRDDLTVFRPSDATWHIYQSSNGQYVTRQFGGNNYTFVPTPGDFDGDGVTDFAAWQVASGRFYISYSRGGSTVVPLGYVPNMVRGLVHNIPVIEDVDGDGRADLGVYVKSPSTAPARWTFRLAGSGVVEWSFGSRFMDTPLSSTAMFYKAKYPNYPFLNPRRF